MMKAKLIKVQKQDEEISRERQVPQRSGKVRYAQKRGVRVHESSHRDKSLNSTQRVSGELDITSSVFGRV